MSLIKGTLYTNIFQRVLGANPERGLYRGLCMYGTTFWLIKGDTRSLDYRGRQEVRAPFGYGFFLQHVISRGTKKGELP